MKMWTILSLMIFLFAAFDSSAQEITVVDRLTQEHVPSVKVTCPNTGQQLLTNSEGRFRLEFFESCDSIVVSYPKYITKTYSYEYLRNKVIIELEDVQLHVEGVIVTANRWGSDISESSNRVMTVPLRDIELQNPQTSADLLESSGYVYVQKSQFAGGSPQLRGYGTNRVMLVVDGVRMNNAIFRSGNLQNVISIDPLSLSGLEVSFGPGSVMFGSDAIGGVMDFTTKQALFSNDSTNGFTRTNLLTRYGSASNELTGHADFSYGSKRFAAVTAVTYSSFGNLTTGSNGDSALWRPTYQEGEQTLTNPNPLKQVHSGYDQLNVIQKFGFKTSHTSKLEYGFNFSTNLKNAPRYDRLTLDQDHDGELDYEEWYYGPQEWMMHRLSFQSEKKTKFYDEVRIVGAFQQFKESRHDRKMGSSKIRHQYEQLEAYSLNIDLDKSFGAKTKIFYGIEGLLNHVHSNANRVSDNGTVEVINPRYPDGSTWQSYGIYVSLKQYLNESWILNAGLRYSQFIIAASFDTTLFAYPLASTNLSNGSPSGSVGVTYHPNERLQAYFNVSSGFRAPNIDDLGKVFDSEPGTVVVPFPNLKPEHVFATEVGFVKAFGNKFKLDGALYGSYLIDALARKPWNFNGQDSILYEGTYSQVVAIQNVSNAYTYGVQGGFEYAVMRGLTLSTAISYQRGFQFDVDSNAYFPKAQVAPLFGRISLKYKTRQLRVEAYSVFNGRVDYERFPLEERNELNYALDSQGRPYTASWYTLNLKMSYFFNKHLSVNAGVENILDQGYRTYGSGISAAGRNFIGSVKVSF